MPHICDYEGSQYRTEFWEGQNREYEDHVERVAMQKLLPPRGERLIEFGAGFGRLADLYQGYGQVVLADYARTQLEQAQNYLGNDKRFVYVVADVYRIPFVDNLFDALTMVRVMHHLADVPAALAELYRVIAPDGTAVIEHASKFHLKALLRWLLRRQDWNPFEHTPFEFVELNFDFHPAWMRQQFRAAGFCIKNTRTVSHFRLNLLKRLVPLSWLITLDSWAQSTGNWWQLTPSLFLQAQPQKSKGTSPTGFFRCPACHSSEFFRKKSPSEFAKGELLICQGCQRHWSFKDGIYDFKTPLR
jgi:ubiquinone/menaquinone biosynthesis C-methylase UbiE